MFLNDLVVSDDEETGNRSILLEPLAFRSKSMGEVFTVPKGFKTDYASIPRLVQLVISKMGRHRKAAVVHDYLYNRYTQYKHMTRKQCDIVFLEAMKASNVPMWKRWSMYQGVRVGGWVAFRK